MQVSTAGCFERFNEYVKWHNAAQGSVKHNLRHGVLKTAEVVLRQYAEQVRDWLHTPMAADADELPPFYTNRAHLAALCNCGKRTVYDHLEKLVEIGYLQKRFRGRQHDFTLWINPWIIVGEANNTFPRPPAHDLSQAPHPGFRRSIRQTSPLQYTSKGSDNTTNKRCESVENVDRPASGVPLSQVVGHIKLFTLNREVQAPTFGEGTTDIKRGGGGAAAADDPLYTEISTPQGKHTTAPGGVVQEPGGRKGAGAGQGVGNPVPKTGPDPSRATAATGPAVGSGSVNPKTGHDDRDFATKKLQQHLLLAFWKVAKETLWPDADYSEGHVQKILSVIWTDVLFGAVHCSTDQASHHLYAQRIEQIGMAEKWANKQKWPSFMPPTLYFSAKNYREQKADGKRGNFHFTTSWLHQNQFQAAVVKKGLLIDKAIDSVLNLRKPRHQEWKNREATTLNLYTYWSARLRREVADPLLTDRFHKAILAVRDAPTSQFSPQHPN